ncbi:MAG: CAP domain-containing protein [Bacteroidales bacterium]|jgi:uncharacterized protein YkwD|nr:CAP domain-containing protein [Bacteroidales bacterium]
MKYLASIFLLLVCLNSSSQDTTVVIKDCLKTTTIKYGSRTRTIEETLKCFWNDAIVTVDTIMKLDKNGGWSMCISTIKTKSGKTRSSRKTKSISHYIANQLKLDTLRKEEQEVPTWYWASRKAAKKKRRELKEAKDTTINIQAVLDSVNSLRAKGCKCGDKNMIPVTDLKWSNELETIAFLHAKDMFQRKFYSHITPDNVDLEQRFKNYGYSSYAFGENIAAGNRDEFHAFVAWKKSPGHCQNMMRKHYKYIGIARYRDKYCMVLSSDLRKTSSHKKIFSPH